MDAFLQVLVNGLLLGAVLALVSVGLSLIFGVADVVNFAHGAFVMLGMYVAYWAWRLGGFDPLAAIPLSALAVGLVGVASYYSFVRYAMRGPMLAQIFVTFGLLVFLQGAAHAVFSPNFRAIRDSILAGVRFDVAGVSVPGPQLAAAVGSLAATGLIAWFVERTRTGHALMATSQDRGAAAMLGIDTNRMFALAWFIGAAAAGVAAALLAVYQPIYPTVGLSFGLAAFMIVALGGFGSIWGAFLAAFPAGLVESFGGFYVAPTYKEIWLFALFLVVMLFRPQGLLGKR